VPSDPDADDQYDIVNVDKGVISFDNEGLEFLHDYDHSDFEISGYDNVKLKRKDLLRNLRILRNVFNFYK
jgi:hypothetical protein